MGICSPGVARRTGGLSANICETTTKALFLDAIYKFEHDTKNSLGEVMRESIQKAISQTKFQHARYDGSLAGTEDGMVLFYTDLLAKLWALDYFDRAPESQVPGFVSLLKVSVSPIYEKEQRRVIGNQALVRPTWKRLCKRQQLAGVFADRDPGVRSLQQHPAAGQGSRANASSSRFLGWWNDHYAQVAEYEPQYKRLNEIMKWSVILGWLQSNGGLDQMSYLGGVEVKRNNWFPDWAQHKPDLKFHDWIRENTCEGGGKQRVEFYAKGYQGVETESMPILYSCHWALGNYSHQLSGGVSLGSATEVAGKPALADTVDVAARRADLEPIEAGQNETLAFRNTDKTDFRFLETAKGEPAEVKALASGKLRGTDVEMKGTPIEASFHKSTDELTVDLSANGHPMSELVIRPRLGTTDIDVFDRPKLVESARAVGRSIGRAVGDAENPLASVGARVEVGKAVQAGDTIYVELHTTPGIWIRYAPEGDPQQNIAYGADMRMGFDGGGGGKGGSSRWNVSFLDPGEAGKELSRGGRYLVAEDSAGSRPGVAFAVMGHGPPPPPGRRVIVDFGDGPPEKRDVLASLGESHEGEPPHGPGSGDGSFGPEYVSRKAAEDPNRLLLVIAEDRKASLYRADKLVEQGRFEEARQELDNMAFGMPYDPDVQRLRAIAAVGSHAPDRAAVAAALHVDAARMPDFAAQLDVAAQHVPAGQTEDLRALLVGTAARSRGEEVHYFYRPDGSLGVEVAIPNKRGSVGVEVTILDGQHSAGTAAGTADLRYTFAMQDTVPTVGVGPIPAASKPLRIEDPVIGQLEPDRIFDPASGFRYDRASAVAPRSGVVPNRFQTLWNGYSSCNSLSRQERARRPDCRDTVVIDDPRQDNRAAL